MKGRILNIVLVLVLAALPMTANAGWSEAQQLTDQTLPAPAVVEQSPAPDADFNSSPVMFIENVGQWDDGARFQVWGGRAGTMWLADDAIWITVVEPGETSRQVDRGPDPALWRPSEDQENLAPRRGVNIKIGFVGANPQPRIETFDRLDTTVSYFYGNDPDLWRPDVPVWGGVRYVDLYPGIDLELMNEDGQMVQRLAAQPGADLSVVQLRVEGADGVIVDENWLRMSTSAGDYAMPLVQAIGSTGEPAVQAGEGQTFDVLEPFVSQAPSDQSPQSALDSPDDNPADLLYGTFLGGGSTDYGWAIAVDGTGNSYITGSTGSSAFPTTPGVFDPSLNGGVDVFVAKMNPAGSGLVYATFLGGQNSDEGYDITIDGTGSAYVVGYTNSSNFPTTAGAFDRSFNGASDTFVAKLSSSGAALAYATFVGGTSNDYAYAMMLDATYSASVVGFTQSTDFPTTSGALDRSYNGNTDAFVLRLNAAGSALLFSSFLGGPNYDSAHAVTIRSGEIYVAGGAGAGFPTTAGAYDTSPNGCSTNSSYPWCDAFVTKLNSSGSSLVFSTYLGGQSGDWANGIVTDASGSFVVVGPTFSSNFPVTSGAYDRTHNGDRDVFVTKVSAGGNSLLFSTFVGGSSVDYGNEARLDASNDILVSGGTGSSNFPTTANAFDRTYGGSEDAYLFKLAANGSSLLYSTYLGGSGHDWIAQGLHIDSAGRVWLAGQTYSSSFPTTAGAFDRTYNGSGDAFVTRLAVGGSVAYSVSGRVSDVNGVGIPGVVVRANASASVLTDANGTYVMSGLAPGTYTITPSKSSYTFGPSQRSVTIPPPASGIDFTGYDRPPIVFVHGWNGMGDSCNWVEPDGYFQQVDDSLRSAGYHVEYARLESSSCYTPPIQENVWRLDNAIQMAKAITNRPQVILISHSMGGLVTRAYLEGNTYDDDVLRVFTFGSPHRGVPEEAILIYVGPLGAFGLGAYCVLQPAVCEFSELGMLLFNMRHSERRDGVWYHVISGDAPLLQREAGGIAMGLFYRSIGVFSDDGAVGTFSGLGLPRANDTVRTQETHGSSSGPRNYFIWDGNSQATQSYQRCLAPILVSRTRNICLPPTEIEDETEAQLNPTGSTPITYGTVMPGQTTTNSAIVPGGPALFAAQWTAGTVEFSLVSPSGQVIDQAYAVAHPNEVSYAANPGNATYSFTNASAGTWQVRLRGVSVPSAGSSTMTYALFETTQTFEAGADALWYRPGATAVITAALSPAPQNATVVATVLLADASSTSVTLTSLGSGRYRGAYVVPAKPGYAEVRVRATGVISGGAAFDRGTSVSFQISPNTATLRGNYSATPEPRWPGASIYQALNVSVGVNVNTTGSYGLSAELVDAAGNPVAHANVISDLTSGERTLTLRFDGADIYESQRDGPYRLTNLLLTDHNGATLVVQEAQNVYTTAAYRYRDFRTGDLFLPVIMR